MDRAVKAFSPLMRRTEKGVEKTAKRVKRADMALMVSFAAATAIGDVFIA